MASTNTQLHKWSNHTIELTDITQGGPFNLWGCRIVVDGIVCSILRSYEDLIDGANRQIDHWSNVNIDPTELRVHAKIYGSLCPAAGGDTIYT